MFLDDINRDIRKKQGKWKYWDRHETLDLGKEETVIPFIEGIRMLYIKNIGSQEVNIDIHKMQTKLFPEEEKYFPGISGRQAVIYVSHPGGKLFVGQSKKENNELPKNLVYFFVFLMVSVSFGGCVTYEETVLYKGYATPGNPKTASSMKLPRMPKTPKFPKTPGEIKDPLRK